MPLPPWRGTAWAQIMSCGADGLLKLWSVASGECVNTLDEHEDKVRARVGVGGVGAGDGAGVSQPPVDIVCPGGGWG